MPMPEKRLVPASLPLPLAHHFGPASAFLIMVSPVPLVTD